MFEAKSEDIRRFFDLLGSIFCGLVYSFAVWEKTFQFSKSPNFLYLPVFIAIGLSLYLIFYNLIWRVLKTKALYGYANFLLISILSILTAIGFALIVNSIFYYRNIAESFSHFESFLSRMKTFDILLFFWATSLPMAFFWFIGILTSWKFSKKSFLP